MSVFRRKRRGEAENDEPADGAPAAEESADGADLADSRPARGNGPWDISEVPDPGADGARVDLGGMWLPGRPGLEVRIEADQETSHVVAVTLVLGEGALQVQPFAAPRTESIWAEVRDEIRAGITKQGGTSDEVVGPVGTELRTRVPVRAQDGTSGVQPARFLGVDGPRWFLRGVITGRPAVQFDTDGELIDLFRDIVVVRGALPMAPRDPIPLSLPPVPAAPGAADPHGNGPDADPAPDDSDDGDAGDYGDTSPRSQHDLKPFQRGPEITEIH